MRGHGWRNAISCACRSVLSSTPSPPPPSCSAPSSSSALLQQHRIQSRLMSNLPESTVYGGPISQTAVKRVTLRHLAKKCATGQPITMVTAYDYPSAVHVDRAGIDIILVGDSVAMVVHGHDTTLPITLEDRLLHSRAVGRGAQRPVLVGDLPFGAYEQSPQQAVDSATRILKEGGMDAVKLEGAIGSRDFAERAIVEAGIAVMGQVGLTPETMIDLPKGQIGQEAHICGRNDGVLNTEENVQVNNSGSEELLGQEVHEESNTVNHVLGSNRGVAAILAKPPRLKSKQRNSKSKLTGRALRSCSSSTWKLKPPGRKGLGGATLKPRHDARTLYALNRQINTLMESGYREEAYAVYEMILPAGCKPDSYTYLHLIKGFCEGGELAEARELFKRVLAEEEDNFCGRSEVILYNAMVHGLGSAGLVKEALDLVEEMRGRGVAPDMYTYNSILHSLGKVGKVTEALTIFESMADKGCSPDVVTYNSVILCLGKAGKAKEAYKLYEGMRTEGCLPDHVTFNTLIPILGKTGELDLAINLYEFMTTSGCEPDVYTYTSLVTGFCRANRIDEALLLSVEMTKKGCAPNTATFNSWLDGLCKGGRVVEAGLLFDKMLVLGYVPDKITYSILIDAFCKTGQFVDKSFELLKDLLKCSTCILDTRTSEIVYQSFKKVGMLKQANRIARNARAKQSRCVSSGLKLPVSTLKMVSETVREPH